MINNSSLQSNRWFFVMIAIFGLSLFCAYPACAQMDQGAIVGTVQDMSGAVVPDAQVVLTDTDTGLVLRTTTDKSGVYVFSPIKIGAYQVSADKPGFDTTTQLNLHLDVQQRLDVVLHLRPGTVSTTVVVSTAPPLLQTDEGSTGTTFSSQTIASTPLSQLNYVWLVQMAPGVTGSVGTGARGQLTGDYVANGERPEQTNFTLDGVDDNSNIQDFMNGSSFVVNPPPLALSEFKVQTTAYSAEFGHSAGSVVNATIKSGTNQIHGSLWEYFRNSDLNAATWEALTKPAFHQNLYGATFGAPILHNKLFFFGYGENNRTISGATFTESVPSALMRQGNFTELSNASLTSSGLAIKLYQPGSAGTVALSCNGVSNVICPAQVDSVAQRILNMYPQPNTNGSKVYNNFKENVNDWYDPWQWGTRFDWNISSKDQAFVRLSYQNQPASYPPPLGALDGGAYGTDGTNRSLAENFVLSETHSFNPRLTNEFRFGYNYGNYWFVQPNFSNPNYAASLGLGGIPSNTVTGGGLPDMTISGIATSGTAGYFAQHKDANVYQILDNVTKVIGNHSLRVGVSFQSIREYVFSPVAPLGSYDFSGYFTSNPAASNTGYGAADFLLNQMASASLSNYQQLEDAHWYRAAYVQDDWKVNPRLTLNLGLRYDYFQPDRELNGIEGNFVRIGPIGPGIGKGALVYPESEANVAFSPSFASLLASQNISITRTNNPSLVNSQKKNFGPRVGFAFRPDDKSVLRGGFGIFFGGLENGQDTEPINYPYQFTISIPRPTSCTPGDCNTNGITLENGFSQVISEGIANFASQPTISAVQQNVQTSYSESFNLTMERTLSNTIVASLGYVGEASRHLIVLPNINAPAAIIDPRLNADTVYPFPLLGSVSSGVDGGMSSYNSLQATLNKRFANGLQFQTNYTWAHALGDQWNELEGYTYRAYNMIGMKNDYTNSPADVRQRLVFNGLYELPFGLGKAHLNHSGLLSAVVGGWSADLQYIVQTGLPFTVGTDYGGEAPNGASANAIRVGDPFVAGGSPPANNPTTTCAQKVRTITHWYNPCAFTNPPAAFPQAEVAGSPISTQQIEGLAVLPYLGDRGYDLYGPGWNVVNLSLFKTFPVFREQNVSFRADIFNLPNIPTYSNPSTTSDAPTGGQITGVRAFQQFTETNRFIQLSATYRF